MFVCGDYDCKKGHDTMTLLVSWSDSDSIKVCQILENTIASSVEGFED